MDTHVRVKLTDVVACACGHSAPLKSFKFVLWQRFREPGCSKAASGYYYCQCQLHLPLLSGEVEVPNLGESAKKEYAKPIAFRQGGSNRWPRVILSFPDKDKVLKPEKVERLESVIS